MLHRPDLIEPTRVGLYFVSISRSSYLIAKTFALGGCKVFVRHEHSLKEIVEGSGPPGAPEREYCSWLFSDDQIQIVDAGEPLPEVDLLAYQISSIRPRYPRVLSAWTEKADRVAAWNSNDHESTVWANLRMEVAAAVRFAPFLPRTGAVVMRNGRLFARPSAPFARPAYEGCFVHPMFLKDPALRAEMYEKGWRPEERRPVRLIFGGNSQPPARQRILDRAKSYILSQPNARLVEHFRDLPTEPLPAVTKLVLWMPRREEHADDVKWTSRPDVIPPEMWPSMMRASDFAFSPPAYELKAHRVIESLLQGLIPIVDCPEVYDVGLRDGINCIVVRNGDWHAAISRALECDLASIIRMRTEILELSQKFLSYEGAARRWLKNMGLATPGRSP